MITDIEQLIEHNGADVDNDALLFYNVTFKKDFGVFKEGEKYRLIAVVDRCKEYSIEADNEDGDVVKTQKYHIVPVE